MTNTNDNRWPAKEANSVAAALISYFTRATTRMWAVGSLRRQKETVGDIELLYIPKVVEELDPADMFGTRSVNLAELVINRLENEGVLNRRLSVDGHQTFGAKNKLVTHLASGIPIDLFAATDATWFNQLICRTGPAELNVEIARRALKDGWTWNVYGEGFTHHESLKVVRATSEEFVFQFVHLPFLPPEQRHTLVK